MALNEFEGTVMLVSHDRALLRAVCDEFWMVSRGGVEPFDGDLDDYQRYLLEEAKRLRAQATAAANEMARASQQADGPAKTKAVPLVSPPAAIASRDDRKLDAQQRKTLNEKKRPLKKELDALEKDMAALEAEKQTLHEQLSTSTAPAEIAQAGKRLKLVEDTLASHELRWLELSEALDQLDHTAA